MKFHPRTGHEGLILPTLPLGKNSVPDVPEAGWASVQSGLVQEISPTLGFNPQTPAHS